MRAHLISLFEIVAQEKVRRVVRIDRRAVVGKLRVGELIDFAVARSAHASVPKKYLRCAVGAFGKRA